MDQQQFAAECVGQTLLHGKWKDVASQPFSEFGDIMDDFTNLAELALVSQNSPVLVIIEQHVLAVPASSISSRENSLDSKSSRWQRRVV